MNEQEVKALKKLLHEAIRPVGDEALEPSRDLWPAVLRQLDGSQRVRVPWWDWALLAAAVLALCLYPAMIPALLYHF